LLVSSHPPLSSTDTQECSLRGHIIGNVDHFLSLRKPPTKPIERNGPLHSIFLSKSSNSNGASKPEESATPTLALDNEAIENLLLISDVSKTVAEPSSSLVRLQPAIDEVVPEQSIGPTSDVDTQANNYLHL